MISKNSKRKIIKALGKYSLIIVTCIIAITGISGATIKYYASKNNKINIVENKNEVTTNEGQADSEKINNVSEGNIDTLKKDEEKVTENNKNEEGNKNIENNKDIKLDKDFDNVLGEEAIENGTSVSNSSVADDAKDIENRLKSWNFTREDEKKIAYLTFDDGPSVDVTPKILDVLKKNDVKATFFVLGSEVEKSQNQKEILKAIKAEGHAIANHGYCHRYDVLYPNGVVDTDTFINDMKKSEDIMKSVLGQDFHTRVIRFPGGHGSWDTSKVDEALEKEGYAYIDWNTLSGDAEANNRSVDELEGELAKTVSDLEGNNDVIVVLMHDKSGKETTAESLDDNIKYLKSLGYEFRTLE